MTQRTGGALHADLFDQPGHLFRRAQQISVSMFLDAVGRDVTPVQYAILRMLQDRPGIDQVTLAREVALDTSTTADIAARLGAPDLTVIDARATPRFRGEVEPLDPVAGHIPGALNRPFALNLDGQGRFKPAALLRQEFEDLLAGRDPTSVVHHCGSGVSALPNLLAMAVAGLGTTALYPGSWSAWCNTPGSPIAKS